MKTQHQHNYVEGTSKKIAKCICGRWEHINLKEENIIAEKIGHTPTPWKVDGPVQEGTIDIATGKQSAMRDVGYGIRGVEPKMYGGTIIGIEKGITKENAEFIVRAVNSHEALLEAAEYISEVYKDRLGDIAWDKLQSAIKMARGE